MAEGRVADRQYIPSTVRPAPLLARDVLLPAAAKQAASTLTVVEWERAEQHATRQQRHAHQNPHLIAKR